MEIQATTISNDPIPSYVVILHSVAKILYMIEKYAIIGILSI